jgi:hypothetical protein
VDTKKALARYCSRLGWAGERSEGRKPYTNTVGVVYATQYLKHTVISVSPQAAVSTIAGSIAGTANGIGTNAQFNGPLGIAIDSVGSAIFICDQYNHAIRR